MRDWGTPMFRGPQARRWKRPFRPQCLAAGVGLCVAAGPAASVAQAPRNTELLGHLKPQQSKNYNDCWGYTAPNGTEIVIIGLDRGTSFVDVTDPTQPQEVGFFDGIPTTNRCFRTHGHYAYGVNEAGGGMDIFDLADPRRPLQVGVFDSTFTTAHTIGIYDGFAYAVGCRKLGVDAGMRILDLSDPVNPREVGAYTLHYVHDIFVRDDVAYCSTISRGGFTIVDVRDKRRPREVLFRAYPGAATHNAWLTDDSRYLLTTDETTSGHLRIWDLQNSGGPLQVAEWTANPGAIIHNVYVMRDSAYIAYYTEGLQVLDISDPLLPLPVASYDTWPGASGGFFGAWAVYPYTPSGNIYISDIASGLYVVRLVDGGPVADFVLRAPESQLADPGETLLFSFDLTNTGQTARTFSITATNTHGWPMTYPQTVRLRATATDLVSVFLDVPADVQGPSRVELELCVESQASGRRLCAGTGVAVPVLLQGFTAHRGDAGVVLEWELDVGPGERGELLIRRAPGDAPAAWSERARLPLADGRWVDGDVERGRTYVYHLAADTGAGVAILGQRTVEWNGPRASRLLGNEPNPFNPTTRIRFELARAGEVRLAVFDARGRLVRALVGPELPAGQHALVWNGEDDRRRLLPSGLYYYEIASSGWRARGKLTLAR